MSQQSSTAALEAVRTARDIIGPRNGQGSDELISGSTAQGGEVRGDKSLSHANPQQGQQPAEPQGQAGQDQDQRQQAMVPSHRLKEEADRRREMETRAQQFEQRTRELEGQVQQMMGYLEALTNQNAPAQAAQTPPELDDEGIRTLMIEEPGTYHRYVTGILREEFDHQLSELKSAVHAAMQASKLQWSDALHRTKWGERGHQVIKESTDAARNHGLIDHFMAQPDPVGACIEWYRTQRTQQQFGTTQQQILANAKAILMNDQNFLAEVQQKLAGNGFQPQQPQPPQQQSQPQINPPPPFASVPRSANAAVQPFGDAAVIDAVRQMSRANRVGMSGTA